jgi:Ca2+-binding EF-hand superfamily protein
MSEADLAAKLKAKFTEFDANKDHTISRKKLNTVLAGLDPTFTQEELDALFDTADKNGNGVIEYEEFIDFICFLGDGDGVPAAGQPVIQVPEKSMGEKIKLLDINAWKKAASGSGSWGFMSDQQAGAIRNIVLKFPELEAQSPEGLTLAEEFVLLWENSETGELPEYTYFGSDEPYHNALFGACLLGLRARNLLTFTEKKCAHLGKYFLPKLSGEAPEDSKVLKTVYDELSTKPDNSLKMWFEAKSGKWGQDSTTKFVLESLVERNILDKGEHADVFTATNFPLKDKDIDAALKTRLREVTYGNREADSRSLAMLALCRTVDMRNPDTPDVMLEHIFGTDQAAEASKKVEEVVSSYMSFSGVNVEMLNDMLDQLPNETQKELEGEAFWSDAYAKFEQLDTNKSGKLEAKELSGIVSECMSPELAAELLVDDKTFVTLVLMFDQDNDGYIEPDEFVGFLMWCKAMSIHALP